MGCQQLMVLLLTLLLLLLPLPLSLVLLCSCWCRMEPIDRIHCIQKERWELMCCICRQRMGAKIQCQDCYQVQWVCVCVGGEHQ